MTASARQQVAINLGFTLLKSAFVLLSIRLADVMLTAQMMGLVLLFRRQGALWSNLVQLGLSQVLVKYYAGSDNPSYRVTLWRRILRWSLLASLAFVLLSVLLSEQLGYWLLGSESTGVTIAFGVYVAGMALGYIANSSWLAEFRFIESNVIDWLHGSLLFVICLLLASELTVEKFSWLLATLTILASLLSLHRFARYCGHRIREPGESWSLSGAEQRYGVTRALTAFVDMVTLVLGPWLLRHQPAEAAQLIAAYTVLRIAQTVVMPIAQVLALRANSRLYDSNQEERRIWVLCGLVFICAWLGVAAYYVVGHWVVGLWLPNSSAGVTAILDVLMPFMPGICLFYALRSYIDLCFVFPWNLATLLSGVLVFVVAIMGHEIIDLRLVIFASSVLFSVFYLYALFFVLSRFIRVRS